MEYKKARILRALLIHKIEFCIFEKSNSSIATKVCDNLLNNCRKYDNVLSARHNSMTKLWCILFKCGEKNWLKKNITQLCSSLK